MDTNAMRNNGAHLDEYFRSNHRIVSHFLEEQFRMFELQRASAPETDSGSIFMSLMELNKEIVLHALDAQKYGVSSMPAGGRSRIPALELIQSPARQAECIEQPLERDEQRAQAEPHSSDIGLEQWMKEELARITGFPAESITGAMKFEEELGLVSINMVELFARFVEQFPHLNRDIVDIIGASTIDDFIRIMTANEGQPEELSDEVLLNWIRTEISQITGFPAESISRTMKFEEDLGLVSINMIEIFSHMTDQFPDLNRDIEDVIGASSIDELIDIILTNQHKKKGRADIAPEERHPVEPPINRDDEVIQVQDEETHEAYEVPAAREVQEVHAANGIVPAAEPIIPAAEARLLESGEAIRPELNPDYEEPEETDPADEPVCGRIVEKKEKTTSICAIVRLFSDPTTLEENRILGISIDRGRHAFLSIENISDRPIRVGKLIVAPRKTVSLGTLSMGKTKEYGGLWYGLEARNIAVRNIYGPRASIRCDITQSNLDVINEKLPQFYSGWSYLRNCAFFASTIWNSISTVKITGRSPLTAKMIYDGIVKTRKHVHGIAVPHHHAVYHADGDGLPVRSDCWNERESELMVMD